MEAYYRGRKVWKNKRKSLSTREKRLIFLLSILVLTVFLATYLQAIGVISFIEVFSALKEIKGDLQA